MSASDFTFMLFIHIHHAGIAQTVGWLLKFRTCMLRWSSKYGHKLNLNL